MPRTAATPAEIDHAADPETEVEEAIALWGGDIRAALRSTLAANAFLEAQVERLSAATSAGFTRGRIRSPGAVGVLALAVGVCGCVTATEEFD